MRTPALLSDCLVDSDAEANRRAKSRRRKALIISLAVQAALLAALLITPILMPGSMSARYVFVPLPPIGGGHTATHHHTNAPISHTGRWGLPVHQPPSIPAHVYEGPEAGSGNDEPPSIGPSDGTCDSCPPGPGIPDGFGNGPVPPQPPPPAAAMKPLLKSQGAQEALLIHRIEPVYPQLARQIHLSGVVELQAIIAKDGSVVNLQVMSGNPLLAQSAVDAVKQWRYRPTLLNGQPVEVQTIVTVKFVLY